MFEADVDLKRKVRSNSPLKKFYNLSLMVFFSGSCMPAMQKSNWANMGYSACPVLYLCPEPPSALKGTVSVASSDVVTRVEYGLDFRDLHGYSP